MVVALGLGLVSAPALAQSSESAARAAARKLGYDGVDALQQGQYAVASEKLEKAYAVLRVPSLGVWSARALAKLDKLVEATDRYLEVSRLPLGAGDLEVQAKAQLDAQAELEATQQQTPSLVVRLQGAEASSVRISVDGAPLASQLVGEGSPLNPGRHHVEGTQGDQHVSAEVTLARGEQRQVTLDFRAGSATQTSTSESAAGEPAARSESSRVDAGVGPNKSRRLAGWVALGGGVIGVAVGGVAGVLALSQRGALDKNPACADDHSCPHALAGNVSTLNTLRTVSTVSFIAGGALAATGIVLIVTAPKSPAQGQTALWLSPTSVGLTRRF